MAEVYIVSWIQTYDTFWYPGVIQVFIPIYGYTFCSYLTTSSQIISEPAPKVDKSLAGSPDSGRAMFLVWFS